jgi:hypothetical protein
MGDSSTHLIFSSGYWALVHHEHHLDNTYWVDRDGNRICVHGTEEKLLDLSEVK